MPGLGKLSTLRFGPRRHSQPLDHGLIVHHAGVGEHPPRSTDFCYVDAEFAVAQFLNTIFLTSIDWENSGQQPYPPHGFHPAEITSL